MKTPAEIKTALAAFFEPGEVKVKPQTVSGSRALAVFFLDARAVMDRLDAVLGVEGWQDAYQILDTGDVVCTLRCLIGSEWLSKSDVGNQSGQPASGDRVKAAFSDALKRAAAKWGVGRFLYRCPHQWCDYDPQRKQFVKPPRLPDAFLPQSARNAPRKPAEPKPPQEPPPQPQKPGAPQKAPGPERVTKDQAISLVELANSRGLPAARLLERYKVKSLLDLLAVQLPEARQWAEAFEADGKALAEWLSQRDAALAGKGLAQAGELLSYVDECARRAGEKREPDQYTGESIRLAVESANEFARQCYATPAAKP